MNSHDKRYRGGVQGHGRHGDGFCAGAGFMDETDREVSSLTDRAFRSLCIGEEAVYNDSSPAERHKAFADDAGDDLKASGRGTVPRGVAATEPYGGTAGTAPMFPLSAADEAAAHHSNGVVEAVWQQKQSSSKVSSVVRTYDGNLTSDAALTSQDSVYTQGQDSWDSLALMSIQKELSEFSSVYHQSIQGSSYSQTRNHLHSSGAAAAPQLPPDAESSAASPAFSKSGGKCGGSGGGLKVPGSRNFFLHSEFSPFQTWKEYNRLLYDREALPQGLSTDQSPRWYDSPFYKELTGAHRAQMAQLEEQRSRRKPHDSPLPAEPPAPTVRQKVSAIEKRSESELMVNCPPWKRSQEPVKNKFPQNRPCTASPSSDKSRRKEEGSVSTGRLSATSYKVQTVADDQTSNSGTPFSICQLLTPTILPRQGTETSEILQYALSPNILSPPLSETDPRQTPEIKPRNKYKAMASSLLFNLKDNRKRVKSTYTPTMFKSTEIADHGKQPSQLDSLIGRDGAATSDTPLSWTGAPTRSNGTELQSVSSPVSQNAKTHTFNYSRRADGCQSDDYLTLISPRTVKEASSYRSFSHTPQETMSFRDKLADGQSGQQVDPLFTASKPNETPAGKRPDPSSWKATETGSSQGQNVKPKAPEVQGLPHSFNRKENDADIKDFSKRDVPTSRANEHVENARAREQYDYKLEAEGNLIRNTNKEKGIFRTERVPMMGDIAALLEKDRQLLDAQRVNADKQGEIVSGEKYGIKNEFFANQEKGNATQELSAMKEKQCTQNELFRKNEASEIHPSVQGEVKRQNVYAPNEGLNSRQEYRHINQGLYDTQENYSDNLAANKGLYPTREIKYTSTDAFGRNTQANQAVPATRENRPVKNEFVVKEQEGIYLQGQVRQRVPSRTDDRNGSNFTSVVSQYDKTAQELSQRIAKDSKHSNNEAFAFTDNNPTKQATERNAIFASETANQVKHGPPSASGVRYAPIEEFARNNRELEKQKLTAMGDAKHEPVKVQALIKQYEGSIGENRNGAKMGLLTTGECKETRIGGVQEKYMSNTFSATVPEQARVLHAPLYSTAPSDTAKDHRGFTTDPSGASEYERSATDVLVSGQSKPVRNETVLPKEQEAAPPLREKGQTRQEILTSKLKAHAEKEIFAIKEKGHAKWDVHATKPKELYTHGNRDGELVPTEHGKKNVVPANGNRPAHQNPAAVKEAHGRNGASINQEASPSVDHVRGVIPGDGESRLAKPASTTREKEHSRNYIIAKTEKISIRQEELQSIARAKIEAIAVNRTQQPKRANEESGYVPPNSPSGLGRNAEDFTTEADTDVSQAEADYHKKDVHTVREREQVGAEVLPEKQEKAQNLGIADYGTHTATNVPLNKEVSKVSQVAFVSAERTTNKMENRQVAGEMFLRREREGDTGDGPVNKEDASVKHPTAEHTENKTIADREKHKDAPPVIIEKEHARNYVFVSNEKVTVKQEVPPSVEHIGSKNTIANNEPHLVREEIYAVEKDQAKNEPAAIYENHQVKLDSPASRKTERAENDTLGIQIRSTQEELSPVTDVKIEAIMEKQRQESTHELASENRDGVIHELPRSSGKENEKTTVSENTLTKPVAVATGETEDKNNVFAKEAKIDLEQEIPLSEQQRNTTFAVKKNDAHKQVEKEHAKNGAQNKERDLFSQEGPSVEHIRIKIISHDEIPWVSESVFALGNPKRGTLQEYPRLKLDSVASRTSEHDHKNAEEFQVKQKEFPPIVHVEPEVVAISEILPPEREPENRDGDYTKLEISPSVEKEDVKKDMNAGDDNYLANPETVVTREDERAKNNELAQKEKISVVEDEPPSVEHIMIKIISHDASQADREKIVSIGKGKEKISLHEERQVKQDSLSSGKNETPDNNAIGFPERIRSRQESPPVACTEAETTAVNQWHEATHKPANKDRDTTVYELPHSMDKVDVTNEATAVDETCQAEPEAVSPRETEGDGSEEERIDERPEVLPSVEPVTRKATAEEDMHSDEEGMAVSRQKEPAESYVTVSEEEVSFKQDEPSVKHIIQIIPVDEANLVRDNMVAMEKEHPRHEAVESLPVKLDSLASRKNEGAEKGHTERAVHGLEESLSQMRNESVAVNRNHQLENVLERTDRNGEMSQTPISREKETISNETAEISEKQQPKPEDLAARESENDPLTKNETFNLGWEIPLSLECVEKANIQMNENQPVKLEVHEHAKSDVSKETDERETVVNTEKGSDGQEEFSLVAHIKAEVKADHKPKHEIASKVTHGVRQDVPQPREDEPLQEGRIAVIEKHKQEELPKINIELFENVLAHNKTESIVQEGEEQGHSQKEASLKRNDHVTQSLPAGRRERSGSFVDANKKETNARNEEPLSTPLTKSIEIGERHQAKHDLAKRDGEKFTQERAPSAEIDYLGNKTTTVNENRIARQEVIMTQEGDAKNEAVMNEGRDEVRLQALPLKKNEQARHVRSVTDKIHQAVLAGRNGSGDSESSSLKTKRVTDESIGGDKQEVPSTRGQAAAQNEPVAPEETLQFKLEAFARRRKEKVEKHARENARRGERASTPHDKTQTLIANRNRLAKHGLVIDDTGHITYGESTTREKENVRNEPTACHRKMEGYVVSDKEYGKKDNKAANEAASVRHRERSREREHRQNEMLDIGDRQAQRILESQQRGRIHQALRPSENIRNESPSASGNDRATKEAFAASKKQDDRNFGVANKVGDWAEISQDGMGTSRVKGKLGLLETQVEKDLDRHGHIDRERIKDRHEIVSPREKENDKMQVMEKGKESVRMETGAKKGEYTKGDVFPTKRSVIRKGELSPVEKGPTILDYLLEKDRDRGKYNSYAVKETDSPKQEVHETKDPPEKEVLEREKKELIKNKGFARRGNNTVGSIATTDREGAENKECGGKVMDSLLPEGLVRKYEGATENTLAFRDEPQMMPVTNEAAKPKKEEFLSLSEYLKERATHNVLVSKDHPKQEAIATSSSKQEMDLTREREPVRKDIFAVKGKGDTAGDGLSRTDYIKTTESANAGRSANRQEEQYQHRKENIFIIQDKDLSKSAADAKKEKELSKQEIILSKGDANQVLLAKNVPAKSEVFSADEKVHTQPEVHASTDKAKYHTGKEALSPERQGHSSKHPTPDERDNSHRRNVVSRGKGKMEMEDLPNAQNEMRETLALREKQREIVAMREQRAKERAIARLKQQHYEQEALAKQEYATYKTLPIKEKPEVRPGVPAHFEKENAKREVLTNNQKDRTEMASRDQPSQNIEGQNSREPHNQYTAPSRPLQANSRRGTPISSQQPGHVTVPSRESYLTVGDASQSPEEEYKARPSSRSAQIIQRVRGSEEKNVAEDIRKDAGKPAEALQYYAIINHEPKTEGGERAAASSQSRERTPRMEASGVAHGEVSEAGLAQSRVDHTIPTARSDTSSPSPGKAILFKVKDNSLRASPVTKTMRPSFQRTLEDQRLGSSQENLSVVEKADEERNRPRENVDVPVLHNAAATSARVSRSRELPGQHSLPATDSTTARALQAHNIQSAPEYTPSRALQAHNIQSAPEYTPSRAVQAHSIQSAPDSTTTRALQAHNIQSAPDSTTTRALQTHNIQSAPEYTPSRALQAHNIQSASDSTTTRALQTHNIQSAPEYTPSRALQSHNIQSAPDSTTARALQAHNIQSAPEYTPSRALQAHNIQSVPDSSTARALQAHNIQSAPEYTPSRALQAHNLQSAPEYTATRALQAHNIQSAPELTPTRALQAHNIQSAPELTPTRALQAHNIQSAPELTPTRALQAHNIQSAPEYTPSRALQAHNLQSAPEYTATRALQAHNLQSAPEYTPSRALQAHNLQSAPEYTPSRALQAHNIQSAPESTTEPPAHSVVPSAEFISVREPRTYYRRSRPDGRSSVISTMSEDLESCGTSVTGVTDDRASLYSGDRPESACSDMRPFGKPPSVPPKSERALLRAKKLTTRRIKKAEVKAQGESPTPPEHKPLRTVASMPSSPTEPLLSRRAALPHPALPQYCVEPGYGPHPPSLMAQPFPLTQRKLLQDPNSGQYFVVDMPVPVKTKMFFDPETGKYVQLSVRQSPERTRSNTSSVELLSPPPYVLYPGFLPVPVSTLPPHRSASQMSAPATLMGEHEKRSAPRRMEALQRKCSWEAEPYIEPAYRSHDQPREKPSNDDERGYTSQRNLNIIPMGELEDFAMESN